MASWLNTTGDGIDKAMVFMTFTVTAGTIFFGFGMGTWFFGGDNGKAWTLWLLGFGLWTVSLAIFFYFMNDPYPRHRKRR